MEPLAACGFHEAPDAVAPQPVANFLGRFDHTRPFDARTRIEIENNPVGMFEIAYRRSPWMDFQYGRLNEGDQTVGAFDGQHRLVLADINAPEIAGEAGPGVFCVKAVCLGSRRAADETQHPIGNMRKNPTRDGKVEIGERLFGDAGALPQYAFRMGETRLLHRLPTLRFRRPLFEDDLGRVSILAQSLE